MINKFLIVLVLFVINLNANETQVELKDENRADCLILEDENSIICKYIVQRSNQSQNIQVQWIDPIGDVSRIRDMVVPAGHGSIYDYRYIKGRILGIWTFKVLAQGKEYTTQFELKASN